MSFLFRRLLPLLLPMVLVSGMAWAKDIPRPKLKPMDLGVPKPAAIPADSVVNFPSTTGNWPKDVVAKERAQCAKILAGLAMAYKPMAPLGQPGGCGAAAPILITTINGTRIQPPAEATCTFAEQLHGWVTSSLQPTAENLVGRKLRQIDNASAYVCRRRNGLASGKLSEHAKANAFDIARLHFDGDDATSVAGDWSSLKANVGASKKASFLALIRRDACIRFTTVLGPGSDKYHGDHFHVDFAQRKNGYRICK